MTTAVNKSGKPKGYSAGKKDLATFSCRVDLGNGQRHKLEEMYKVLTPTIKVSNPSFAGSGSRWDTSFDAFYGPVIGAWESDIRKKVQAALDKVGSTATIGIRNAQRLVMSE